MDNNKIHVFDTTLRDGEQVPGCQLNSKEKVEIAPKMCCKKLKGIKFLEFFSKILF